MLFSFLHSTQKTTKLVVFVTMRGIISIEDMTIIMLRYYLAFVEQSLNIVFLFCGQIKKYVISLIIIFKRFSTN